VSTTGYSAVIDYKGKILQKTSMATTEHIFATVGLIEQQSLRDKAGDWASVFTLIFLLVVGRRYGIDRR
jgi:apolipoprotein N-acyltransferase